MNVFQFSQIIETANVQNEQTSSSVPQRTQENTRGKRKGVDNHPRVVSVIHDVKKPVIQRRVAIKYWKIAILSITFIFAHYVLDLFRSLFKFFDWFCNRSLHALLVDTIYRVYSKSLSMSKYYNESISSLILNYIKNERCRLKSITIHTSTPHFHSCEMGESFLLSQLRTTQDGYRRSQYALAHYYVTHVSSEWRFGRLLRWG